MSEERAAALRGLGFEFSAEAAEWMAHYNDMARFRERHGHSSPAPLAGGDDFLLTNWCADADVVAPPACDGRPTCMCRSAYLHLHLRAMVAPRAPAAFHDCVPASAPPPRILHLTTKCGGSSRCSLQVEWQVHNLDLVP